MTREQIASMLICMCNAITNLKIQLLDVKNMSPNDYVYNIELDKVINNANNLIYGLDNLKRSISANDNELEFLKESCERYIQYVSDMVKDLTLIRISNQERLQQIKRRMDDQS